MIMPARSNLVFWGFLACLVGLTWMRIDLHQGSASLVPPADADMQEPSAPVVVPLTSAAPATALVSENLLPTTPMALAATVERVIRDTLGSAGSIYLCLKDNDVAELQIARLGNALAPVFDAQRSSRPGDAFALVLDSLDRVVRFEYTPALKPEQLILVVREGDDLVAERAIRPLITRTRVLRVVIDDNLSNAIAAAGESDALTDIIADDIFAAIIDFHRDPRQGDELELVIDKLYMEDRFIRYERVQLARYRGQVADQIGVYFESLEGRGGYYDASGKSLARMFLLKPMDFRRISSHFSRRRFHPILKRNVPHLGTDYAASIGTVVHATARGRVTHAGWNGGYGKMVEISHANGYRTRYAHLSRISVRKGQRIEQKDRLGNVGATGRATGPHLHYELIQNGRHINPTTVNRGGRGEPLGPQSLPAFAVHRDRLLMLLPQPPSTVPLHIADAGASRP